MIRSLVNSWVHMKENITHNESIKTFDDITCHLELEDECLKVAKSNSKANVKASSSCKAFGPKYKQVGGAPKEHGEPTAK